MVRGERARQLARTLLDAMQPLMPPDVIVSVHGARRRVRLTSRRTVPLVVTLEPGDPRYDEALRTSSRRPKPVAGETIKLAYLGGSWQSIAGFGQSRSRRTSNAENARCAMVDALEILQRIVAREIRDAWPAPGATVQSQLTADSVSLWFETPTAKRFEVGAFDVELA